MAKKRVWGVGSSLAKSVYLDAAPQIRKPRLRCDMGCWRISGFGPKFPFEPLSQVRLKTVLGSRRREPESGKTKPIVFPCEDHSSTLCGSPAGHIHETHHNRRDRRT